MYCSASNLIRTLQTPLTSTSKFRSTCASRFYINVVQSITHSANHNRKINAIKRVTLFGLADSNKIEKSYHTILPRSGWPARKSKIRSNLPTIIYFVCFLTQLCHFHCKIWYTSIKKFRFEKRKLLHGT